MVLSVRSSFSRSLRGSLSGLSLDDIKAPIASDRSSSGGSGLFCVDDGIQAAEFHRIPDKVGLIVRVVVEVKSASCWVSFVEMFAILLLL